MGSSEPTPQIPQKHGIFGTFPRNRAELGCRSKTEDIVTDGFIPHGLSAKRKSVTMILHIKNEGIFIVTLPNSAPTFRTNLWTAVLVCPIPNPIFH